MRNILASLLLAATILATAGCDTNGYASFGDPLDTIVPCGGNTTAWVRSTCGPDAQGEVDDSLITELITLGTDSLDPLVPGEGCFNFTSFNYDASSRLKVGGFSTEGDSMTVSYGTIYTFTIEKHLNVLQRRGSDRNPIQPPERHEYTFELIDGDPMGTGSDIYKRLELTDETGATTVYYNLTDIIGALDLSVEEDGLTFSNIAAIPMYQAFTRLLGYGAGGMTQYMDSPATFAAASTGELGVVVTGGLIMPLTNLDFREFEEFAGFVLDGDFDTLVNTAGNGYSYGDLGFTIPYDSSDPSAVYTGRHEYYDVDVDDGYAGAGCYGLVVDGYPNLPTSYMGQHTWEVPSEVYNTVDLSGIVPTVPMGADDSMAVPPGPGAGFMACSDFETGAFLEPTVCPRPVTP